MAERNKRKQNAKKKNQINLNNIGIHKPVPSTQSVLPIRDIVSGIVVTKDKRYVKIIEVKPTTFFLKSISDQNATAAYFAQLLKTAPHNIQFSCITLPADLKNQLSYLEKDMEKEDNENCLTIGEEYKQRLIEAQSYGVQRRFFISFEFEGVTVGIKKASIEEIIEDLNATAIRLTNNLKACGNEVIPFDINDPNGQTAEILYTVLNKYRVNDIPFNTNLSLVMRKYFMSNGSDIPYILPTEYLAPKRISFLDSKYVVVDGKFYSFLYMPSNGYDSVVFTGWTSLFVNSYPGVDTHIYLEKVSRDKVMYNIRRNLSYSQTNVEDSSQTSMAFDSSNDKLASGYYLKNGLSSGQEFFYVNILLSVSAGSPQEVDAIVDELKKTAKENDMRLMECRYLEEKAFISSLPLCHLDPAIEKKTKRNVLTEGAASTYPFTAFELNDDDGIYIGNNMNNNSLVSLDIFNTDRVLNANMFIAGTSGSGKTFTLQLLAERMRLKHIPVMILAPEKEHEFRRLCDAIGGQFVQICAGSPTRINIMEIFKRDETEDEMLDGSYIKSSYLSSKVQSLKGFFQLLVPDITPEEKQLLDVSIIETYRQFGITNDNNSLFDPEYSDGRYRKMPIISDLKKQLETNSRLIRLSNVLGMLTVGSGESFNGQTNVDLSNPFTVIGLANLDNEMMPLGIYIAMDYCWSRIKEDRTKKKVLFIDEWWKLAINPIGAEYSMQIAKTIRAYSGSMVIATQQFKDILKYQDGIYGEAVLSNCQTKIILMTEKDDIPNVKRLLSLSDTEARMLATFKQGQALLMAGRSKVMIKFIAGDKEIELISTDRESLNKLKEKNAKIAEMKKEQEKINSYPDFDKYFKTLKELRYNNMIYSISDIKEMETQNK